MTPLSLEAFLSEYRITFPLVSMPTAQGWPCPSRWAGTNSEERRV